MSIHHIKTDSLCMYFSHKKALDGVSLDFNSGEIHALLGENGAGKSTLAHILSGRLSPTGGSLYIDNKPVYFKTPADAIHYGISMVHQRPALAEKLSIWENILLAQNKPQFFSKKKAIQNINTFCQKWQIELDAAKPVYESSQQERFYTALTAALIKNPSFLIMDEPSSILNADQYNTFLLLMNSFIDSSDKHGIIYITHNIEEAVKISNKISLIKHGKTVKTLNKTDVPLSTEDIIQNLYGELPNLEKSVQEKILESLSETYTPKTALQVRNLITRTHNQTELHSIDISAAYSRITVIKGEKSFGIETFENILTGMYRRKYYGMISINGIDIKPLTPKTLRRLKVGIVPSNKYLRGSDPNLTVKELLIPYAGKKEEMLYGSLEAFVRDIIQTEEIDITPEERVSNLSGGMLQRLILARELTLQPRILILSNPLHGLDRKTMLKVAENLRLATDSGTAVIVLTSDQESGYISHDTIYVLTDGYIQLKEHL